MAIKINDEPRKNTEITRESFVFQVNALSAFFRDWFCQQRSKRTDPIGFTLVVVKVPLSRLTDFEPGFPAKETGLSHHQAGLSPADDHPVKQLNCPKADRLCLLDRFEGRSRPWPRDLCAYAAGENFHGDLSK
jgi:hypothetical protein